MDHAPVPVKSLLVSNLTVDNPLLTGKYVFFHAVVFERQRLLPM